MSSQLAQSQTSSKDKSEDVILLLSSRLISLFTRQKTDDYEFQSSLSRMLHPPSLLSEKSMSCIQQVLSASLTYSQEQQMQQNLNNTFVSEKGKRQPLSNIETHNNYTTTRSSSQQPIGDFNGRANGTNEELLMISKTTGNNPTTYCGYNPMFEKSFDSLLQRIENDGLLLINRQALRKDAETLPKDLIQSVEGTLRPKQYKNHKENNTPSQTLQRNEFHINNGSDSKTKTKESFESTRQVRTSRNDAQNLPFIPQQKVGSPTLIDEDIIKKLINVAPQTDRLIKQEKKLEKCFRRLRMKKGQFDSNDFSMIPAPLNQIKLSLSSQKRKHSSVPRNNFIA